MGYYVNSKRIDDILQRKSLIDIDIEGKESRVKCFRNLAYIYREYSTIPLSNLDYQNIEDIIYIFCLPNFGEVFQAERIQITNNLTNSIKSGEKHLLDVLNTLVLDSPEGNP